MTKKFNHTGYYNMLTDQIEDDYYLMAIRMTKNMYDKILADTILDNQWTIADFKEHVDYIKED